MFLPFNWLSQYRTLKVFSGLLPETQRLDVPWPQPPKRTSQIQGVNPWHVRDLIFATRHAFRWSIVQDLARCCPHLGPPNKNSPEPLAALKAAFSTMKLNCPDYLEELGCDFTSRIITNYRSQASQLTWTNSTQPNRRSHVALINSLKHDKTHEGHILHPAAFTLPSENQ